MAGDNESDNFSWTTSDDEPEIRAPLDSTMAFIDSCGEKRPDVGEASSSSGSSSLLFSHFVSMGFSDKLVIKAIEENGDGDADSILETLLMYQALGNSPIEDQEAGNSRPKEKDESDELQASDSDLWSSGYEENLEDNSTNGSSDIDVEESSGSLTDKNKKLIFLEDMKFPREEALIALERCPEASIEVLADFILAAQIARAEDPYYVEPPTKEPTKGFSHAESKKRRPVNRLSDRKKQRAICGDDDMICLPKPMVGFGVPTVSCVMIRTRKLPEEAVGPPFFFYENVALAPKGVWNTISRFLYDVEPEFVDSKYFCATARKRGYIHNLPIDNRYPTLPLPHRTIQEALPLSKKWWPSWDHRTTLNCIQTAVGSAKLTERIRKQLEEHDGNPPLHVQKNVLDECRRWNLVWVGRNKVAPLEPDEIEKLLGFPKNHTRGVSRTDRYKSLGNSFQVDTVIYLLSPLKELFPKGMNVLSLFSGIGGAEVALNRLDIPLKTVVSVEISEVNQTIMKSWWEQTWQKGKLIHINDVQELTANRLKELMNSIGGFDLVIGGSPCNNLAGSNRVSRDGLEGEHSSLFFDYVRILDQVKSIMRNQM